MNAITQFESRTRFIHSLIKNKNKFIDAQKNESNQLYASKKAELTTYPKNGGETRRSHDCNFSKFFFFP
jgi:hypothetical protein